ncbi:hypothetical protein [Sporisorium scitamineum]|uniref:Uncharacterized protein n=1 Tax=Sporisorium scitamineum TaxID=49012 RepID=A0A0F7S9R2_9BASI|nr:hypothetical protein [Sporisorium scitamineum]
MPVKGSYKKKCVSCSENLWDIVYARDDDFVCGRCASRRRMDMEDAIKAFVHSLTRIASAPASRPVETDE